MVALDEMIATWLDRRFSAVSQRLVRGSRSAISKWFGLTLFVVHETTSSNRAPQCSLAHCLRLTCKPCVVERAHEGRRQRYVVGKRNT